MNGDNDSVFESRILGGLDSIPEGPGGMFRDEFFFLITPFVGQEVNVGPRQT